MKTWTVRFRAKDKDIFDLVKIGKKDIETRAATPRHMLVNVGDTLLFLCGKEKFSRKVSRVAHYPTLEELFKSEKLSSIVPWVESEDEARKVYFSFPGYKEKIKKFGIVAWELSA